MIQQALFDLPSQVQASNVSAGLAHGVVYTKPWVVNLILDLAGYTSDQPLFDRLLLEPSAGDGSFLGPIVERLIESCRLHEKSLSECSHCIAAFELDPNSAESARQALITGMRQQGVPDAEAKSLAEAWVRCGDFLLESGEFLGRADFVLGNPPYIRLEEIPSLGERYRRSFPTMIGRADIYVAFFEASLRLLGPAGICSFICADRWMFNQYGSELRKYVTQEFAVDAVLQMHHADAFHTEVSAYPAVTVLRRGAQETTVVASLDPAAERAGGTALAQALHSVSETGRPPLIEGLKASRLNHWFSGVEPWPLLEPTKVALLRRLESSFPTLEQTGAIVGIGVATGADKVFITTDPNLVEDEQLLPLAMARDVKTSELRWSGHYLVNPWNGSGLVDLAEFPRLRDYLHQHRAVLQQRHIGQRSSEKWFRTIDRVTKSLTDMTKLYLPDFKGRIAPVIDRGQTYPHHNLYYVVPEGWDAEVLGGLLLTDVAQFFIEAYGVRMRGGYLRFQAQYLRRIRVPRRDAIPLDMAQQLRAAFQIHNVEAANEAAAELYGLTTEEQQLLRH